MTFEEIVDQALAMLQRRGRVAYRTLKRQFNLDDDALDDLKVELIEAQQVAIDEDGKVLVWTGDVAAPPLPASAPVAVRARPSDVGPRTYTPAHLAEKILTSRAAQRYLTNWMPTLIQQASGASLADAAWMAAMFQAGGTLGAVVVGRLMDKYEPHGVLCSIYLAGSVCVILISLSAKTPGFMMCSVFAAGLCVSGGQVGANALSAAFYPTPYRATGVSWANGVGRLGSVVGSLLGGGLLVRGRAALVAIRRNDCAGSRSARCAIGRLRRGGGIFRRRISSFFRRRRLRLGRFRRGLCVYRTLLFRNFLRGLSFQRGRRTPEDDGRDQKEAEKGGGETYLKIGFP